MSTYPTIPIRTNPLPNETFLSFVARLADVNLLPATRVVLENLGLAPRGSLVSQAEVHTELEQRARALGTTAKALGTLAPASVKDEVGALVYHEMQVREQHVERSRRRVSPAGLSSSAHLRFQWQLSDFGFCPETWDVLIDHCPDPQCGKPLSRLPRLSVHWCDHCDMDLRNAKTSVIDPVDRPPLRFLADLVSQDELERKRGWVQLHPELRHLNPGTLLQLVNLFGRAAPNAQVQQRKKDYDYCVDYPSLTITGARLLRGYPNSILQIVEQVEDPDARKFLREIDIMSRIGLTRAAREAAQKITKRIRPIARSSVRAPAIIRNESGQLTLGQAATKLGLDKVATRKLVDAGVLGTTPIRGTARKIDWIAPEQVEALAHKLNDRISTGTIHSTDGLPQPAVEQLVELGVLRWHPDEAVRHAFPGDFLVKTEFHKFLSTLKSISVVTENGHKMNDRVTLSEGFALVGPLPKPWGPLLKAAVAGTLDGGLQRTQISRGFKASNLTISRAVYIEIQSGASQWHTSTEPERLECGLFEAEERLACGPQEVADMIKAGHLKRSSATSKSLTRASVIATACNLISTREIAARLGLTDKQVGAWARKWGLERHKGLPLWDRETLEQFLPSRAYSVSWPTREKPLLSIVS